jgi:hypothetical protein
MEKRTEYELYITLNGKKGRDRSIKRHFLKIKTLGAEKPTEDDMNLLEGEAKSYIQNNFKTHDKSFKLEALHFEIADCGNGFISKSRMLFGDDKDVKQLCTF